MSFSSFDFYLGTVVVIFGVDVLGPIVSKFKVLGLRSGPRLDTFVKVDWDTGTVEEIPPAIADVMINSPSTSNPQGLKVT